MRELNGNMVLKVKGIGFCFVKLYMEKKKKELFFLGLVVGSGKEESRFLLNNWRYLIEMFFLVLMIWKEYGCFYYSLDLSKEVRGSFFILELLIWVLINILGSANFEFCCVFGRI